MKTWKYIVYETTNLVNGKIYIGIHKTEDPDKFDGYIGNGVYVTQPYTYEHSKTAFQCAVKKYGPQNFKRKTLAVFNTEKEASDLEEQIVNEKFLEREDVYNMILGGLAGCLISQRIKVYQYDLNGNYINEYESFADAALQLNCDYTLISYAVRKKSKAKGFLWNTDKVEKLDLAQYNLGLNHSIKVYCYTKDGNFFKEFDTCTKASKKLGICMSSIKESYTLGNCVKNLYYFSTIQSNSYDKARTEYLKTRTVHKYNVVTGSYVESYDTQLEAQLENPRSNITKSIRLKEDDGCGFIWALDKLENYNKPHKNEKRQVGKYDLENNLICVYESATAASKENGTSVWKVLNGTNQTHKGHIYKYMQS